MKKTFGLLVLALLVSSLATAQFGPVKGKMTLGPALELSLPVGNFSDVGGFGVGGTARFEYGLDPKLALTGNLGYLWWSGESNDYYDYSYSAVPLLAGVKYQVGPGFFVSGEAGLYFFNFNADFKGTLFPGFGGFSTSASSTDFMLAPGIGYQKGPIEGLLRFFVLDTDAMNFSLMVAYNFPLN